MSLHRFAATLLTVLTANTGCDESSTPPSSTDSTSAPVKSAPKPSLPRRPTTSVAHSEKDVITFRSILENRNLSREQRIEAFKNLDPNALQEPLEPRDEFPEPTAQPDEPRRSMPSRSEYAAARRRVSVVMYSTDWCGVCRRARDYFERANISFVEHNVDEDEDAREEFLRLNSRRSVPTITIDDDVIVGFSPETLNSAIDTAAQRRLARWD